MREKENASPAALLTLEVERRRRRRLYIPPAMRATRRAPGSVAIQPLGAIPPSAITLVDDVVGSLLGARTLVLPAIDLSPELAPALFDAQRRQYDADRLLELLFNCLPDAALRIVGVLDADMFAAGRTFVFGYAHLRDGVGVYSLARLREEWYGRAPDETLLEARAYRALAHELGHTFGNPHCDSTACVMHAVSHIESLDGLSTSYCNDCLRRVRRGALVAPASAEGMFQRAGALLRRRFTARAVAAYREATEQAPVEARYHNDLGVALLALGDRPSARTAFERAAELASDFPHPFYNLGILAQEEGQALVAERRFCEGLARDRDPLGGHRFLAKLYDELFADADRARHHYRAYVEAGGDDPEVIARAQRFGIERRLDENCFTT